MIEKKKRAPGAGRPPKPPNERMVRYTVTTSIEDREWLRSNGSGKVSRGVQKLIKQAREQAQANTEKENDNELS